MAIQTGKPLGCVIAGAGVASSVMSLGDTTSASELGAMVADAYVKAPSIEEAPQALQMPAVFSAEVEKRAADLRAEQTPEQQAVVMSVDGGRSAGPSLSASSEENDLGGSITRIIGPSANQDFRRMCEDAAKALLDIGVSAADVTEIFLCLSTMADEGEEYRVSVNDFVESVTRAFAAMSQAGWEVELQRKVVVSIVKRNGILADFEEMDVEFPGIAKLAEGFHRAGVAPEWQRMFMESVISKSGYLVPGYCMLGEILQDMLKSGWSGTRVSTPMAILVEAKAPDLALDAYESIYSILKRFVDHDGIADFLKYIVDRAGVDEDPEELLEKLAQPLMQAPKQTYLAFVQSFLEVRRDSGVPLLELLQEGIRQEGWYKIQA